MFEYLSGKKTYILAILGGVAMAIYLLGWIDKAVLEIIFGILGFGGLATLRSAVAKFGIARKV